MLSRVAESLFWMSRYIERAEDMTRLLAVNFHAALDTGDTDSSSAWRSLVTCCASEDVFRSQYGEFNGPAAGEFILWNSRNVNSVYACIIRARENARSVREKISSELWEAINRLYFLLKDANRESAIRAPQDLYFRVSSGSQMFQGITNATLPHGEPYEFIQLGKFIERAEWTVRNLDMNAQAISLPRTGSSESITRLTSLLASVNAYEAFRQYSTQLQGWRAVDFLLLNRMFPRSVAYSIDRCHKAVTAISAWGYENPGAEKLPGRIFGRLNAELQYLELDDILGKFLSRYLQHLLWDINLAGEEISRTYFNTQATVPEARVVQIHDQQ